VVRQWRGVPKNWYDIYQWGPVSRKSYTDPLAALITSSLETITLHADGLRESFRTAEHRGQIDLTTPISQITEKR